MSFNVLLIIVIISNNIDDNDYGDDRNKNNIIKHIQYKCQNFLRTEWKIHI